MRIGPFCFQARCRKRQPNLLVVLSVILCCHIVVPSVLWHCWLCVRKNILSVKIEWWGVVVICLERGADCLHMVQLMLLHPQTRSSLASFASRLVLPSWYWLTHVVLEKRPLNGYSSSSSSSLCCHVFCYVCIFDLVVLHLFTTRCYASAVLAMGLCLSVCVCHKSEFY